MLLLVFGAIETVLPKRCTYVQFTADLEGDEKWNNEETESCMHLLTQMFSCVALDSICVDLGQPGHVPPNN